MIIRRIFFVFFFVSCCFLIVVFMGDNLMVKVSKVYIGDYTSPMGSYLEMKGVYLKYVVIKIPLFFGCKGQYIVTVDLLEIS